MCVKINSCCDSTSIGLGNICLISEVHYINYRQHEFACYRFGGYVQLSVEAIGYWKTQIGACRFKYCLYNVETTWIDVVYKPSKQRGSKDRLQKNFHISPSTRRRIDLHDQRPLDVWDVMCRSAPCFAVLLELLLLLVTWHLLLPLKTGRLHSLWSLARASCHCPHSPVWLTFVTINPVFLHLILVCILYVRVATPTSKCLLGGGTMLSLTCGKATTGSQATESLLPAVCFSFLWYFYFRDLVV